MALINTTKLVEPALMNGNGSPVGGIELVNTSYCTVNFPQEKRANIYCSLLRFSIELLIFTLFIIS